MSLSIKAIKFDNGYVHVEFSHGAVALLGLYAPPLPPITTNEFAENALRQPYASSEIAEQINHSSNCVQKAIDLYLADSSIN